MKYFQFDLTLNFFNVYIPEYFQLIVIDYRKYTRKLAHLIACIQSHLRNLRSCCFHLATTPFHLLLLHSPVVCVFPSDIAHFRLSESVRSSTKHSSVAMCVTNSRSRLPYGQGNSHRKSINHSRARFIT